MNTHKKVTVTRIAREAGVSIATVSRALNDLPRVDKRIQLKIKNIAEQLGYDRFMNARKLDAINRQMRLIVVIYGRAGTHIINAVQKGIDEYIHRTNYYELRYMVDETRDLNSETEKELFLKSIITEKGIAGILSVFVKLPDVSIANLYKHNLPVVLLNNYTEFGKCVTINNFKSSYQAVIKLIELGRKQIGCIMPHEHLDDVWRDRIMGYKQALKDNGIPFNPDLIMYEDYFIVKQAGLCTKVLLEKNPGLDAILYAGDLQAYGGIKMLLELGKRIPEDIALIGFDDMVTSSVFQPSLSSIAQPMYQMGRLGIDILLKSIENSDFRHEEIILDSELHLRKSCLPDYQEEKWSV